MNRHALVFDAGNTLLHLDTERLGAVAAEHGWTVSPDALAHGEAHARGEVSEFLFGDVSRSTEGEDVRHFYVRRSVEHARRLSAATAESASSDALLDALIDRLVAELMTPQGVDRFWRRVLPGTRAKLEGLAAAGHTLGVISNSDGQIARRLDESGLDGLFEVVIDSAVIGFEKPDGRIFRAALDALAVSAIETAYIGDIYSIDVRGAEAVGMQGILVDPFGLYGHLPCRRIRSVLDL